MPQPLASTPSTPSPAPHEGKPTASGDDTPPPSSSTPSPPPPPPVPGRLTPALPLGSQGYWAARTAAGRLVVALSSWLLDTRWDERAFSEGAGDAFFALHEHLAAGDVKAMEPLCSPAVHASFAAMLAHYKEHEQTVSRLEVDELRSAHLVAASLVEGESLGLPDLPEEAHLLGKSDEPHTLFGRASLPSTVGTLYLTVTVRFDSTETCELSALKDGQAEQVIVNTRGHCWQFARAVPRQLPCPDGLQTAWRITGIV